VRQSVVPSFFLYGEPPRAVGDRFLHVEKLDDRSRPSDWNIRPHSHANLNHVFHIATGAGTMRADGRVLDFVAPCLLVVPAGVVHGFGFHPDTTGSVLTIAAPYLDELFRREPDLGPVLDAATWLALEPGHGIAEGFERLARELVWAAPGHRAAVDACLLTILVEVLRLFHHAEARRAPLGPRALLVARFRTLIEARYRAQPEIESYARELKVTLSRLRDACLKIACASPNEMVRDRVVIEAKRVLLYSNMTIAEAGFHLGFDDPAYFSRFFSKATGESPRAFRDRHAPRGAGAGHRERPRDATLN
jgi:AraC family transcriptional activator of pobA